MGIARRFKQPHQTGVSKFPDQLVFSLGKRGERDVILGLLEFKFESRLSLQMVVKYSYDFGRTAPTERLDYSEPEVVLGSIHLLFLGRFSLLKAREDQCEGCAFAEHGRSLQFAAMLFGYDATVIQTQTMTASLGREVK